MTDQTLKDDGPPYVPKRDQSEVYETIEHDWERVFPEGRVAILKDGKIEAKTHLEGGARVYWAIEVSDYLRNIPPGVGDPEYDGPQFDRKTVLNGLYDVGALVDVD